MAEEKINEVMSEEQLDGVTGGTTAEIFDMLRAIKDNNLAIVQTDLEHGSAQDAATELASILRSYGFSGNVYFNTFTDNQYTYKGKAKTKDEVIKIMSDSGDSIAF
ncbi:MAG: hypothetical protein J5809_02490 [Selenomonadaceae bacterium]|nr:hypothetical protein [Selenomonadaceae bacterium]